MIHLLYTYMRVMVCIITPHTPKKKGSRVSRPKLSLGGNNDDITELFLPRGSLVSDIPAGDGKLGNLFLRCTHKNKACTIYTHTYKRVKVCINTPHRPTYSMNNSYLHLYAGQGLYKYTTYTYIQYLQYILTLICGSRFV